jgi:hypothetical protein
MLALTYTVGERSLFGEYGDRVGVISLPVKIGAEAIEMPRPRSCASE